MTAKNHRRRVRSLKLRRQRRKSRDYTQVLACWVREGYVYRKTEEAKRRDKKKREEKKA